MINKLVIFSCILAVSQAWKPRILLGQDAKPGEFPHQVSLQLDAPPYRNNSHFCGGSIINEKWILTAAQCLREFEKITGGLPHAKIAVKAGKHNLNVTEPNEQSSLVESYFIHEDNIKNPAKYAMDSAHDIALIKLAKTLKLNEHVKPIELPKKDTKPTGQVIMSGWGVKLLPDNTPILPKILQKGSLDIITHQECRKIVMKMFQEHGEEYDENYIKDTNICTISKEKFCSGDGGGPVISKAEKGKSVIVGIMSYSIKPCSGNGVLTGVPFFVDWIEKIMSNNKK